jgi:glutamyl/glutaminyl-tRNA synthetase
LDATRYKMEFAGTMLDDMRWFGLVWQEGSDCGGPFAPYDQSRRMKLYRAALEKLRAANFIYPCTCSRKDIQQAVSAPHPGDDELIYPGTCRNKKLPADPSQPATRFAWRFRVPEDETVSFRDGNFGEQKFVTGKDFGDFVIWRGDDVPAYQLACAVDDAAMRITEVVRGADLLVSTARQILLYRALDLPPPVFFHCTLMLDEKGQRLAKRYDALSLCRLRECGETPESLRRNWV